MVFGILIAVFFHAQTAFGYDSLRVEKVKGRRVVVHQVEQGETLYSLSRRYDAPVRDIISFNDLVDNTISLDQLLMIPLEKEKSGRRKVPAGLDEDSEQESLKIEKVTPQVEKTMHTVQPKETLFAISRLYEMSVDDIKRLNAMTTNDLAVGQVIYVQSSTDIASKKKPDEPVKIVALPKSTSAPAGYAEYLVQSGDMLETIARKFNVRPDSIIIWNQLSNTYLAIGQRLIIKGSIDKEAQKVEKNVEDTGHSKRSKMTDQSGFSKIYEEGIAKKIEDALDTDKYLAMHRTLKVGSMVEVRNLMNNKKIFVRIVGKLPNTGINENTLVRMTPICFERLGVIDPKTRVEISYYED